MSNSHSPAAILAAIIAGMFMFISGAVYRTDTVLLSSTRHMKLLSSYDIYSKAGAAVENVLKGYLQLADAYSTDSGSTDKVSQQANEQAKEASNANPSADSGKNSISRDMVRRNVDNIVNGMILYFKGDTEFLPDIFLNPEPSGTFTQNAGNGGSNGHNSDNTGNSNSATNAAGASANNEGQAFSAITGIDRVNLSAILMYTDRQDITDILQFIRMLHHAAQGIPPVLLLLATGCMLYTAVKAGSKRDLAAAAVIAAGTAGFMSLSVLALLYFRLKALMPSGMGLLEMSLPLTDETITGYISDLCKPIILLLILTGLLFPLSIIIYKRFIFRCSYKKKTNSTEEKAETGFKTGFRGFMPKKVLSILTAVVLASGLFLTAAFTADLQQNDFIGVYEKVSGTNTKMKIIPAMNDNIYTLEMKLVDKSSGSPVSGAFIEVEGKTDAEGKFINLGGTSDTEGSARFSVQAGSFRIGFIPEMFPDGFKLPDPLFVNISQAGTTTITVSLEEIKTGAVQ